MTKSAPIAPEVSTIKNCDQAFDTFFEKLVDYFFEIKPSEEPVNDDYLPEDHPILKDYPPAAEDMKNENENLKIFRKEILQPRQSIIEKQDLNDLISLLKGESESLFQSIKTKQQALLWQANHISSHESIKEIRKIGQRKQLSWEDLQRLTLESNLENFKEKTALDLDEAKQLMTATASLLAEGSRLHQMNMALKIAMKAADQKNPQKKQLLLSLLTETLSIQRQDIPERGEIDKLWFEYANGYLYRIEQLEKLRELISSTYPELQAEMPTGFGKSKCLISTLNNHYSKTGKLILNCCPPTVEAINVMDWNEQAHKTYGHGTDYISFDRASDFSGVDLEFLYYSLQNDKNEKRAVSVRPESVRSLELHLSTTLDEAAEKGTNADLELKIHYFILILQMFYTESWIVIDEEHINLSPIDRLIYTMGTGITLPDTESALIEKIFSYLMEEPLLSIVRLNTNNQNYLTEEKYKEVTNYLADKFVKEFEIPHENEQDFKNFILGIEKTPSEWILKHERLREISLLKGELCIILPASLGGKVDTDFGLSRLHFHNKEYAISYLSADTPKETESSPSQFKNPHETITKTFMTYLYKGLSDKQIHKLINYLKEKSLEEAADGSSLEGTDANKFYQKIAPKDSPLLLQLNNYDIDKLIPELKHNKDAVGYYIRNIIVPQLKLYPESVVSTAQNFRAQFTHSLSISATPQEKEAHGFDTHFIPMKRGFKAQVTHFLLTKCKDPKTIHILKGTTPAEKLEKTIDIVEENNKIAATIDIGAEFAGLNNLEIAKRVCARLEKDDNTEGVLFFDAEEGIFKLLEKSTGTVLTATEAEIAINKRKTMYDQGRCFAADIENEFDAVAAMLTSKETDKDEVDQAGGRMRQWHRDQVVEPVVPEEIAKDVFQDREKNIKDLLVYWIVNRRRKKEQKDFMSQIQQMDNTLRRGVFNKILNITVDKATGTITTGLPKPSLAVKAYKNNKKLITTTETFDPVALYANWDPAADTIKFLENYHVSAVTKASQLQHLSNAEKDDIKESLKKIPPQWEKLPLPKTVPSMMDLNMECEVQQEVEVQCEIKIEAQNKEWNRLRTEVSWYDDINLFKTNWDKPRGMYPLFKRAAKLVLFHIPGTIFEEIQIVAKLIRNNAKSFSLGPFIGGGIATAISASLALVGYCVSVIPPYLSSYPYLAGMIKETGMTLYGLSIISGVGAASLLGVAASAGLVWASYEPFIWLTDKIRTKFHLDTYIANVRDIFRLHLSLKDYACHAMLHKNFYATHNFYQESLLVYGDCEVTQRIETHQAPLTSEQKPIFQVVIVQDTLKNGKKELKMIAIDQNDAPFFREKLQDDLDTDPAEANVRTRKIAIYDLENETFVKQGKNRFEPNELENNPEFHKLLASAKFINGDIRYTAKELSYLKEMAEKIGKKKVLNFMAKRILPYHPRNGVAFSKTPFCEWLMKP